MPELVSNEKLQAKVEHEVKRRIRDYAEEMMTGRYTGITRYGGHDHPWEVEIKMVTIEQMTLHIDWMGVQK